MREKQSTTQEWFDASFENLDWMVDAKKNVLYAEVEAMSKVLDQLPEILSAVQEDLNKPAKFKEKGSRNRKVRKSTRAKKGGRPPQVSCEQALRCAVLKQLKNLSYRELVHKIEVTPLYRKFTRFFALKIPHFSTLERIIKCITPATINMAIEATVLYAKKVGIENGRSIRQDSTVVESNIKSPTDAGLLDDCVRVITRLMHEIDKEARDVKFEIHDRTRRSKKRAYQIAMNKGKNADERRYRLYKDLLAVQTEVVGMGRDVLDRVRGLADLEFRLPLSSLVGDLERYVGLAERVHSQAYRRIIKGEQVPSKEKLVSIFEAHTDIIRRGKSEPQTEYGHKVDFGVGVSGLVLRCEVLEGNPSDKDVLPRALDHYESMFGYVPSNFCADRGYSCAQTEELLKSRGVKHVALPARGHLSQERQALQHQPWFKRLLRWRAGIEGCLSTLLRSFGLTRCLWESWQSFNAYVGIAAFTYNLRLLAGHISKA